MVVFLAFGRLQSHTCIEERRLKNTYESDCQILYLDTISSILIKTSLLNKQRVDETN